MSGESGLLYATHMLRAMARGLEDQGIPQQPGAFVECARNLLRLGDPQYLADELKDTFRAGGIAALRRAADILESQENQTAAREIGQTLRDESIRDASDAERKR